MAANRKTETPKFIPRPVRTRDSVPPLDDDLLAKLRESFDNRDGDNAFFVHVADTPISKARSGVKGEPMVDAQNVDTAVRFVRRHAAVLGVGLGVHVENDETLVVWAKEPRQSRKGDE